VKRNRSRDVARAPPPAKSWHWRPCISGMQSA